MTEFVTDTQKQRFGFVAILGAPNAGKSTLVNRLIGAKVSIVSPKVQTTRSRIRGIFIEDDVQLVLVDTPGIFKASRRFDRAMVASAWTESDETDIRLLVVDAQKGVDKNGCFFHKERKNFRCNGGKGVLQYTTVQKQMTA